MLGVEPLDLFHAGAGVLGEIEYVDLAMRENDPHADGCVAEAINAAFRIRHRIMLQPRLIQQRIELTRKDAGCRRSAETARS